jgi:hypothetical protein
MIGSLKVVMSLIHSLHHGHQHLIVHVTALFDTGIFSIVEVKCSGNS